MQTSKLYEIFKKFPQISTDSRKIEPDSLFFALSGENFNGNKFANNALKKGAKYAIIDQAEFNVEGKTILVINTLKALQELANFHRRQLNIPIIGITGTNGKTTTKELINNVLSSQYETFATHGNFNNHIGVPLTLLSMTAKTEIGIVEMGANHVGEINFLCNIAEPNYGIITNVGVAHIEGFGSLERVLETKTELYRFIKKNNGTIFINIDNKALKKHIKDIDIQTYATHKPADTFGRFISQDPFLNIQLTKDCKLYNIKTQLVGKYNLENILAAISFGFFFKIEISKIIKSIENYKPINNRSQLLKTQNNILILDLYNANPSSMHVAIENFNSIQANEKALILGDMLELGEVSENEHNKIVHLIEKSNYKDVYLVGKEFSKTNDFNTFENVERLKKYLQLNKITGKNILIKGSRGIHLEDILSEL